MNNRQQAREEALFVLLMEQVARQQDRQARHDGEGEKSCFSAAPFREGPRRYREKSFRKKLLDHPKTIEQLSCSSIAYGKQG